MSHDYFGTYLQTLRYPATRTITVDVRNGRFEMDGVDISESVTVTSVWTGRLLTCGCEQQELDGRIVSRHECEHHASAPGTGAS